jgi:[ribosomal protein S5]-alanine N-acetyltransferase
MQPPPANIAANLVSLRRARPTDAQALYLPARDPEVMRFMDWPMPTALRDTQLHLEKVAAAWETGSEYQWIILERHSGLCAGTISCRPRGHAADFGYFLGRDYWGKGLASDAASAVISWLAAQPEIIRIWATVDIENARSRRLLERLGLELEGVMRMATVRPNMRGPPRDTAVYARIKRAV